MARGDDVEGAAVLADVRVVERVEQLFDLGVLEGHRLPRRPTPCDLLLTDGDVARGEVRNVHGVVYQRVAEGGGEGHLYR